MLKVCTGSEKSPFWMSDSQAVEVAIGVGIQEHAELILATSFAHDVAKAGRLVVAVAGACVNVLQNFTADSYRSSGVYARKARRQLVIGYLVTKHLLIEERRSDLSFKTSFTLTTFRL